MTKLSLELLHYYTRTLDIRNAPIEQEPYLTPVSINYSATVSYDKSLWIFWMRDKNKAMVNRLMKPKNKIR